MKKVTYIVTVTKVTGKNEKVIFENEYEAEPHEYENVACAHALSIAYDGCADN